jgi:hypothetical protein
MPRASSVSRTLLPVLLFLTFAPELSAVEYYVAKSGSDQADGTSESTAFATVQAGVNALQPGDTLTIGPGEYEESVRRDGLGEAGKPTRIRARIPGTVLLRGDKAVGPFTKTPGYSLVYETPEEQEILCVSEMDTLTPLAMCPNLVELDLRPGGWFYDKGQKKLYVTGSDSGDVTRHRYRGTVVPGDGLCLENANSVTIEGLAATGFNDFRAAPPYRRDNAGHWTIWGFFLYNSTNCEILDCTSYLNGGGIGVNNTQATDRGGDNRVVRCVAYGNGSQSGGYQSAGIGLYSSNGDEIRECLAYKNHAMGLRTYLQMLRPARIVDSISWNNFVNNIVSDIHLKDQVGPNGELTSVEGSVAVSAAQVRNAKRSVFPEKSRAVPHDPAGLLFLPDTFDRFTDSAQGFADSAGLDFRLQSDSPARGAGTNGEDLGAHPFRPEVFYVKADGDDEADGLSVAAAWKTLGRAMRDLKPGQTLYVEPGTYDENLTVSLQGTAKDPITVKGRGTGAVILTGEIQISHATFTRLERLNFAKTLTLTASSGLRISQCQFLGSPLGLSADNCREVRIEHNLFTGFSDAALGIRGDAGGFFLAGNLYDNRLGVAVRLPSAEALVYSDYNGYANGAAVFQIGEEKRALDSAPDRHSLEVDAGIRVQDGAATPEHVLALAGAGPLGKPLGVFREEARLNPVGLTAAPSVHSVSATTANIEWKATSPLACRMRWGDTPECRNTVSYEAPIVGTYSLQGLEPGKTYYFRIDAVRVPPTYSGEKDTPWVEVNTPVLSFTTALQDAEPVTYFVAPDGDDANSGRARDKAWRTIGHAASQVNVGDTVLIAGGTYEERVIIRATGRKDGPITFAALPGEKVRLNGANKMLSHGFLSFGKSHLRFDGFYFTDYAAKPSQGWLPGMAGDFCLYRGEDIQITRCFSDGRGGFTARTLNAMEVKDLLVKNVVSLNKMSGALFINDCDNFRLENSVIARPMIASFILANQPSQKALIKDNIFTDCLEKKAKLNTQLFDFPASTVHENNVYFLRDPAKRELTRGKKIEALGNFVKNPFSGNPSFAGLLGVESGKGVFPPDRFVDADRNLDFASFFATNPEVVQRKIGLQPEAFGLPEPSPDVSVPAVHEP